VAIARALVNDPGIILADEPTGALDSRMGLEIMAIFQRLNRDKGITLIVVTHDPEIATYARRTLHFKDGRLQNDERVEHPRDAAADLANSASEDGGSQDGGSKDPPLQALQDPPPQALRSSSCKSC
jgi:putative ABC transport system ATP-binding protein